MPHPPPPTQEPEIAIGLLLQTGLTQAMADATCLFRLNHHRGFLELVSWRGLQPDQTRISAATALAYSPDQVHPFAGENFAAALSVPLGTDSAPLGIFAAARLARNPFSPQETAALLSLRAPLESLLSAAAAREENTRLKNELQRVTDRLAGRQHIERAKGIMQTRYGWTESEAYLHLRSLSRKTRRPMGEIARDVIVHSAPGH